MADEINTIDVFRDSIDVYELSTEAVQIVEQGPQGPPGDGTLGYYGAFSDYTSQTITSITAAYAMTLNTTDESNGVSRGTPTSKIEFANAGTYNVQWSGQFQNTNTSDHDVRVWLKKNGTDISGSTGFASIPSSHGQVNGHTIIGWNYILTLAAGDYLQFYWSADSAAVSIQTYTVGTNPTTPSTASLIVTAQQVMNLQLGPTGPQGPAGTAGGISSIALAGTGLSIAGSPVTTSGTITANVAYGTTANTATQGNDARIATIQNGTINTLNYGEYSGGYISTGAFSEESPAADGGSIDTSAGGGSIVTSNGGGSINTTATGYIQLGNNGTRTTLNGSASTTNKTITLPNATGTVALTQQATDMEITDSTKGIILNSATKRWRLTMDDNGVLIRTAITLVLSAFLICGANAQVRDLVYNTNNIVIGPTNDVELTFSNRIVFQNPIGFGTGAGETRTNLGVTIASNLPRPYSGAAATNSLLTADGAGGSSFVASRLSVAGLTTNVVRTSWANSGADKPTNDTGLSLTYAANSVYRLKWSVFVSSTWSNVAYGIAFSSTNSFATRNGYQVTPANSTPSGATISVGVTNTTLVSDSTTAYTTPSYVGGELVFYPTNAGTVNFRFWTTASNTNTSTLLSNSVIQLEKIYP